MFGLRERGIEGLIVATVTPYNSDYSIDIPGFKWLVGNLVERGVSGVFIGTTGEWPLLSIKERLKLFEAALEASKGRFVIGVVTGINAEDTWSNALLAADVGIDAVASVPPLYFRPPAEKLKEFYIRLSMKTEKPVIIYTIPSLTGYNLPVEVVRDIALEASGVKGIKATVYELTYILDLLSEVKSLRKDFSVLPGYGEYLLASLAYGGDGAVDAVSNVVPGLGVKIIKYFKEGMVNEARLAHEKLYKLARRFRAHPLQSLLKKVLARIGAPIAPYVRPPLGEAGDGVSAEIASLLCREYAQDSLCISPQPDYQHI